MGSEEVYISEMICLSTLRYGLSTKIHSPALYIPTRGFKLSISRNAYARVIQMFFSSANSYQLASVRNTY